MHAPPLSSSLPCGHRASAGKCAVSHSLAALLPPKAGHPPSALVTRGDGSACAAPRLPRLLRCAPDGHISCLAALSVGPSNGSSPAVHALPGTAWRGPFGEGPLRQGAITDGPAGTVPQSASVRPPEGAIHAVRWQKPMWRHNASVVESLLSSMLRPWESRVRRARTRFCSGASASAAASASKFPPNGASPFRFPVCRASEFPPPALFSSDVRALSGLPAQAPTP